MSQKNVTPDMPFENKYFNTTYDVASKSDMKMLNPSPDILQNVSVNGNAAISKYFYFFSKYDFKNIINNLIIILFILKFKLLLRISRSHRQKGNIIKLKKN